MSLATRLTVCGLQRKPLTASVVGGGETREIRFKSRMLQRRTWGTMLYRDNRLNVAAGGCEI